MFSGSNNWPWLNPNDLSLIAQHTSVSEDGTLLSVTTPGVDFEDFYQFGDIGLWKFMKNFSALRTVASSRTGFCLNDAIDADHSAFIIHSDVLVNRKYYETTRKHRMWTLLRYSLQLESVGRSTIKLKLFVHDDRIQAEPLASGVCTLVRVNSKTRRSSPFSETFRQRYSAFVTKSTSSPSVDSLGFIPGDVPDSLSTNSSFIGRHQFVVRPSDCDFNKHINSSIYFRFCLDTATMAAYASQRSAADSRNLQVDIGARRVRRVASRFVRESRLGDIIQVGLWLDKRQPNTLHFKITIENENEAPIVLFVMSAEYFDNIADVYNRHEIDNAKL